MESASYVDAKSREILEPKEVWRRAKKTEIDFQKKPFVKYTIPKSIIVEQKSFEKV